MKTKILLLLIICQISILGQGSGSVYSRFGLGESFNSFSARRMGMGELGFAMADQDFLNYTNPASLNKLGFTRIETGILYNGYSSSNSTSSVYHSKTIQAGFMIGFPFSHDNGIGFALGFVPISNVSYNVISKETNPLVGDYIQSYFGDGGLAKVFMAASYRLPFDFSLGVSLDYYTGKIDYETSLEFNDTTTAYTSSSFSKEYRFNGIGMTAGLISSNLSSLLGLDLIKDFRLGLTFTPSAAINADTSSISTTYIGTYANESNTIGTKLPSKFGIGAYFNINKNFNVVLDYYTQNYTQLSLGGIKDPELTEAAKFSLGFEYRPDIRFDTFWNQVMYRSGISFEKLPYKINGVEVNQFSVFAGISFPLGYENTLDIALQYGKRGTIDNNLIKENIFRFNVTLSLGDLWFIQTER